MSWALYESVAALPPPCAALFPTQPFASLWWYQVTIAHALPDGAVPCLAVATSSGGPEAMVPMLRDRGGRLGSLTTPYSCLHIPLLSAADARVEAIGRSLGRLLRRYATVRLDAIPAEWPGLLPFIAGLRAGGLWVQRFDHFGNWQEPVGGRGWDAYLADRPGALRETLRRKLRRSAVATRFALVTEPADLSGGIAAFEAVYRASWKQNEPFPHFNAALMRALSAQGLLRLGVLWADEHPVAAQFWCVAEGRATVLKLAHDKTYKSLSPGTVLTALMLRRLLDEERVDVLDFGRGDDAYKALWSSERHQRLGLLLMNPARPAGLLAVARATAGQAYRRWGGLAHSL